VIVDYHMHLRDPQEQIAFSAEAIERFVATAVRREVDEIGFTEHVYYFRQTYELWDRPYELERCSHDLDAYCDVVLEAKRQGLPVKLGLEVDYVGARQQELADILAPYPFDFLLGSAHHVDGLPVDQRPGIWATRGVDDVWAVYVDAICELAAGGLVDVFAHLDLAKIFGQRPESATLAGFHERIADAIAVAGRYVEISTAGLRKPVGELYPDFGLLRACRERGVPITLASDAHVPSLVGQDFDEALDLTRDAGCETVTVFENRVGRQEPLG
jgi:histidinol-phosphatase (PHP family)